MKTTTLIPRRLAHRGGAFEGPGSAAPRIEYALSREITPRLKSWLAEALEGDDVRRICELGAGPEPLVPLERIARTGIDYVVVDVDPAQLARVPRGYRTELVNVASPTADGLGRFDVILSRYVLEHVVDPAAFHRGIAGLLAARGRAVHLFSTLYAWPFVANRLLPEFCSRPLLSALQPHRRLEPSGEKFPAYYRWCRGPTRGQMRRFASAGLAVERMCGFFGHSGDAVEGGGYLDRLGWIARRHARLARWLVDHPQPWLTAHALVALRKLPSRGV